MVLSLMILLSSSSFFLVPYLNNQLRLNHYSQQQLTAALALSIPLAFTIKRQQYPQGSPSWLDYSIKLAKNQGISAFQLAKYYQNKIAKDDEDFTVDKLVFWYQQAIRLGYQPAKLALAQWYFVKNKLLLANKISHDITLVTSDSVILATKIAIALGTYQDIDTVQVLQQHTYLAKSQQGLELLDRIKKYSILTTLANDRFAIVRQGTEQKLCHNSIQLFATKLTDLAKVEQLIKQFKSHPLNAFVCFAPVRYRSIKKLHCSSLADTAIQCDESQWLDIANTITARYIAVLLPQGGANVHLGMLYLDENDNKQVFAHEISHLLGFVDEYPLPMSHANCLGVQAQKFADNIAVLADIYQGNKKVIRRRILANIAWATYIKESTPILHRAKVKSSPSIDTWLLGTPAAYAQEVGVFPAETCLGRPIHAFKPVYQQTQLRYFEKKFPASYTKILTTNAGKYSMPSFHYNLALALLAEGDKTAAKVWLDKSAALETIIRRKNSIITANY